MDQGREVYRECMRNHAATLGTYATDGCGEYASDVSSPGGLHCAACGCHRNFHRKVTPSSAASPESTLVAGGGGGPDSPIAFGHGGYNPYHYSSSPSRSAEDYRVASAAELAAGKRRARTKFTVEQKEQMLRFADKIGWRIPRGDTTDEVGRFCREIGVPRQVFKVWMHNHKNGGGGSGSAGGLGATGGGGGEDPALSSSTTSIPLIAGTVIANISAAEANASSSLTQ